MPDYSRADWSPIANAITNIGTGFANNALKKVQIDRQLGKDIYEAARTEAATKLNLAKADGETIRNDNLRKLSGLFDPENYTPQEIGALSGAAMLGSKSYSDAMRGGLYSQQGRFRDEQYRDGDGVQRLSLALGKGVNPYRFDGRTGAVTNGMTGEVNFDPAVVQQVVDVGAALKAAGVGSKAKGPRLASPSELKSVFSDLIEEKDFMGNPKRVEVRNKDAENAFVRFCQSNGIPVTSENAMLYRASVLQTQSPAPTQTSVAAAHDEPVPALNVPPKFKAVVDALPEDKRRHVANLFADYNDGAITRVELEQLLIETGYFK